MTLPDIDLSKITNLTVLPRKPAGRKVTPSIYQPLILKALAEGPKELPPLSSVAKDGGKSVLGSTETELRKAARQLNVKITVRKTRPDGRGQVTLSFEVQGEAEAEPVSEIRSRGKTRTA